ncbi:MAG: hypothetical protein MJZ32_01255 [Bacteroidaceae bacterium]|nr:hypothetical protein [Bacteroidaceae bacterium]
MQQINPNDFRIKPLQIILYFIVTGTLMFLCLMNGFSLLSASLMSLGVMIALILLEYLIIGFLEKRQEDKEWEEEHGTNK